jgi:hypothetical protein
MLSEKTYRPGGGTALFDAVGKTVTDIANRIDDLSESEKPSRVLVLIMTDGHENASEEYKNPALVGKLIETYRKQDWEFLFIGADEKSMMQAKSFGVSMARGAGGQSVGATMSMNWGESGIATTAYVAMSKAASNYRNDGNVGNWTTPNPDTVTKTVTVQIPTPKDVKTSIPSIPSK